MSLASRIAEILFHRAVVIPRETFGSGRYRQARVQRFEARNNAKAQARKKKARKTARRSRARNR